MPRSRKVLQRRVNVRVEVLTVSRDDVPPEFRLAPYDKIGVYHHAGSVHLPQCKELSSSPEHLRVDTVKVVWERVTHPVPDLFKPGIADIIRSGSVAVQKDPASVPPPFQRGDDRSEQVEIL